MSGVAAILRRDMQLFRSYRLRPVREIVGPIFAVVLFFELSKLVKDTRFPTPHAYFSFAAVGLAALPLLRSGLLVPAQQLREERLAGTFERLAMSSFGLTSALLASLIFPFAIALFNGVTIIAIAQIAFGVGLRWSATLLLVVPVAALTAAAVAPFATLLMAAGVALRQGNSGAGWVVAAFSLVGGVYFPPALLPGWLGWASHAQPLTAALDLLRHVLTGATLGGAGRGDVLTVAAFAIFGMPLAAALLAAVCAQARRRGTLLEY